ncbi:hypothetical protein EDB85DRAFT_1892684 [Lactarius pseudohatsudake]|nr:hypothetical protein EDB85DRAFT_1892684 [Lactarius pseudohatsudake]
MQNAEVRTPLGRVSDKQHRTLKMLLDSQSRAVDILSGALDSQPRAPDRLFNRQQKNELLLTQLVTQRTLLDTTGPSPLYPGGPVPQPKSCSDYPESVLRTLQDYRREKGGSIPRGDYPPKMRLAIRDEDGRVILDADYKDIRSRATHIVRRRRLQLLNNSRTAGGRSLNANPSTRPITPTSEDRGTTWFGNKVHAIQGGVPAGVGKAWKRASQMRGPPCNCHVRHRPKLTSIVGGPSRLGNAKGSNISGPPFVMVSIFQSPFRRFADNLRQKAETT